MEKKIFRKQQSKISFAKKHEKWAKTFRKQRK